MASTGEDLAARFKGDRAAWQALVARVPADLMDQPGAMGDWTFRDAVSHLLAWRTRTIGRLEAAVAGAPRPGNPWPADMHEDDPINGWFRWQDAGRSADDLLAAYDASFDRMGALVASLPASANPIEMDTPGYFRWNDGHGELESDFSGHLADHLGDLEAWLAPG